MGDGVNIAARIEGIADPGGVACLAPSTSRFVIDSAPPSMTAAKSS